MINDLLVEDEYQLADEEYYSRIEFANNEFPLEKCFFKLIKAFNLSGEARQIELKSLLIRGELSIKKPDVNIGLRPIRYSTLDSERRERDLESNLYRSHFNLAELCSLPLPLVTIVGCFTHIVSKRTYDITIDNAFLTQDFPGSFFRRPVSDIAFAATEATVQQR